MAGSDAPWEAGREGCHLAGDVALTAGIRWPIKCAQCPCPAADSSQQTSEMPSEPPVPIYAPLSSVTQILRDTQTSCKTHKGDIGSV